MKRKIAAIVAADIAGYSRLVAEDEEETLRRLATYRGVFNDLVARFGGRIFNTAGDAVLAEFQSAVDAVRCAVDLQESLRARNLAYPPSREMSFRIGITIGDVVERDGDLLGDGVNVAARLEAMAPAGGICISQSVYEAVANKLSIKFSDIGRQHLKNIPDPVHAYTISLGHRAVDQSARPLAPWSATIPWTVISLLLVLLAGSVGYLLSKREAVEPSDTVAMGQKNKEPPSAQSTAEAKATETRVQVHEAPGSTSGPASSGSSTSQGHASSAIEVAHAPPAPTVSHDPLAQEAILKRQWRECYEGTDPDPTIAACTALIDNEVGSNADRANLNLKLGRARRDKGDAEGAVAAYSEAIRLLPSTVAYNDRGIAYYDKRQWDRAIADYGEAIRIDPKNGEAFNNRAWTRIKKGDAANALADAETAVQLLPDKSYAWDTRAKAYTVLGNREAAIRDYRKALALDPGNEGSKEALRRLGVAD